MPLLVELGMFSGQILNLKPNSYNEHTDYRRRKRAIPKHSSLP